MASSEALAHENSVNFAGLVNLMGSRGSIGFSFNLDRWVAKSPT